MSFFEKISPLPEDPIFGLYAAFQADPRPQKVNLAIGIYKDAADKVPLFECVRQAEKAVIEEPSSKAYLPIEGHPELIQETLRLIYGPQPATPLLGMQTIGGSGGLSLGGLFLASQGFTSLFLPEPSWPNHLQLFARAGLKTAFYPYGDQRLDFSALCASIQQIPAGSILLLHVCCHNPTGLDLSFRQWQEIEPLIKKQRLFPFFDLAYQGLGDGLEADVAPIRLFAERGHEMMVSSSFSKNFGLYGERVGVLSLATPKGENIPKIASHFKRLIRSTYSNPPLHGARLVAKILRTPSLRQLWEQELTGMRERLAAMRQALRAQIPEPRFPSLSQQRGLFFMTGLSLDQVQRLRAEKALYLLENGRLNIAGLNAGNLESVVNALLSL